MDRETLEKVNLIRDELIKITSRAEAFTAHEGDYERIQVLRKMIKELIETTKAKRKNHLRIIK